jgi:hypothetical protein
VVAQALKNCPARPTRQRKMLGVELAHQLSKTLDPSVQVQRDSTRAESNLAAIQVMALHQQIRDLQSRVAELHDRLHVAEVARAQAEFKLDLLMDSDSFPPISIRRRKRCRTSHQGPVEIIDLTVGSDSDPTQPPKSKVEDIKSESDLVLPLNEFA